MKAVRGGDAVRNGAHLFVRRPDLETDARGSRTGAHASSFVSPAACRKVRAELPRLPIGKIDKQALKRELAERSG